MSRDPRKNAEGYMDPTAFEALRSVQRQFRGKQSKAAGEHFEKMISRACAYYYDRNIANIEKTPEPMKVLKPMPRQPGRFIACFVKAGQPDFKGTIQGGRAIVFEAKHTDGNRIERRRLTTEQVSCLEKHNQLGALTFVVVSFGLRHFYRIPWPIWRDMKKLYGRQYLKQEEITKYKIPAPGGVIKLLDGVLDGGD
ncbi:Holliday junction resolvase RecU [Candidatus Darwinibacter acetoxidans]